MGFMTADQMLLRRAEEIIGLPVGTPTQTNLSVTGEPYVILTSGGIKAEGGPYPTRPNTRGEAVMQYLASVKVFAAGQTGKLYWRVPPSLHYDDSWGCWQAYSRLLISDTPIQEAA